MITGGGVKLGGPLFTEATDKTNNGRQHQSNIDAQHQLTNSNTRIKHGSYLYMHYATKPKAPRRFMEDTDETRNECIKQSYT